MMQKIKEYFANFSLLDWVLLAFASLSITISSILLKSSALTIICSLTGVIYVILWAKRYKIALIFCLVYVSLYIWQSVNYQNWGEVIQSGFSLIVAIVLIFLWLFGKNNDNKKLFSATQKLCWQEWVVVSFVGIGITIGYYFLLKELNTPSLYLATSNLSLLTISLYFMIRRHYAMFLFFLLSNLLQIFIWLRPVFTGSNIGIESIPLIFSFFTFLISNVRGFFEWRKTMKFSKTEINEELNNEKNHKGEI